MNKITIFLFLFLAVLSCKNESTTDKNTNEAPSATESKVINLFTHRHYDTDQEIFNDFEKQTGIKVNVVNANADELIARMEQAGDQSPADLLITVDAGRLVRAKQKGLLQSAESATLTSTIPANMRDEDNQWFGVTKRARVIVYDKNRVKPEELSTYEALVDDKWNKKVLIRSSGNIYNQSLMASIIANDGADAAKKWAEGMVNNFARPPKGNDRDQVKAILAGEGDLAVVNTYYLGKLLNSKNPEEVKAGENVSIFWPNQDGRGTHVNVSGIGLAKYAPNKANAIKFMEYLTSKEVQEKFASTNYEYPVNPAAQPSELLTSWGEFKEDDLALSQLGELNKEAVVTFDAAGWN
ncbi:MAG: Fe(3+) ABC transporter substrate-binding protein [Bacteroidota bacterium]